MATYHGYSPLPVNPNTSKNQGPWEDMSTNPLPVESELALTVDDNDEQVQRGLQERHLTMIALAGMIGTGLFLSSGKALAQAGPLGCVLGFITMGTVTAAVALSSAEMSAFKPAAGGFVRHANMWLGKSLGITTGWNFWYSMAITMPAEVSAATTLLGFWAPHLNLSIPISFLWFLIIIINIAPVRIYGEFEFYLAFCKVAFIVFFIVAGLVLDVVGQDRVGFRYWSKPYPLFHEYVATGAEGRFLAFWSTMISAAFAYGNVQVVAIAGAETQNPRKSIPAALKQTFLRVVLFYVLSVFVVSLLVAADDDQLSGRNGSDTQSPFVIAFRHTNIKALPSIVNAVVFMSAFSSANSCTFLASRTLQGLALDGLAPKIFLRLNRFKVPYVAVAASAAWGCVAYLSLHRGASVVFFWLVALVTTSGIISWLVLCFAFLRFFYGLKAQGISRDCLPYKSPYQPFLAFYAIGMNSLILLSSGWTSFAKSFDATIFFTNYLNCFLFIAVFIVCRCIFKDNMIQLSSIDFSTELDLITKEEGTTDNPPHTLYNRILNMLF